MDLNLRTLQIYASELNADGKAPNIPFYLAALGEALNGLKITDLDKSPVDGIYTGFSVDIEGGLSASVEGFITHDPSNGIIAANIFRVDILRPGLNGLEIREVSIIGSPASVKTVYIDEQTSRIYGLSDIFDFSSILMVGSEGDDHLPSGVGSGAFELLGKGGNDQLFGSSEGDRLSGGTGDDQLFGNAGNDRLNGDDGDDVLDGGEGRDVMRGGDGADLLLGGADTDIIEGNSGNDQVKGGAGNDNLKGGNGDDRIAGEDGNDRALGGGGNDTIIGGKGNDALFGDAGNDTITGGFGNDIVEGGAGNDTLKGGDGNDVLKGGEGDDVISGDVGNDKIFGGGGNNVLSGKTGNDTFFFTLGDTSARIEDFEEGLAGGDKLVLLKSFATSVDDVIIMAKDTAGGVVIADEDQMITLKGVKLADLDKGDFGFL